MVLMYVWLGFSVVVGSLLVLFSLLLCCALCCFGSGESYIVEAPTDGECENKCWY